MAPAPGLKAGSGRRLDRITSWAAAALALSLFAGWGYTQRDRVLEGKNDFLQLYTGASLVGTDKLYSAAANSEFQTETVGYSLSAVYYSRPPFYAAMLRPLARLPYRLAYAIFQAISLAAIGLFVWSYRRRAPELPLLAAFSLPLFVNLLNGQDVSLALGFAAAALLLRERGRHLLAGAVFSLCAIKFHLFLFVPIALAMRREWRMLAGGAAGGSVLATISFLAAGTGWPAAYRAALENPGIHPSPETSVTLRAVLYAFRETDSAFLAVLLSIPIGIAVIYLIHKSVTTAQAIGVSLAGGLLTAYHGYLQDASILLLGFALLYPLCIDTRVRAVAALALMPPLYFLTMAGAPWSAGLPLWLLIWLAMMVWAASRRVEAKHSAARAV